MSAMPLNATQRASTLTAATEPGRRLAECSNCRSALNGPYCANCGQKTSQPDITLREFLRETTQELTDWDGKVPQTLKTLIVDPGRLTVDFLAGRRARWLAPLRLYLLCSVAYFLSVPAVEAITHRAVRDNARITISGRDGQNHLDAETRRQIEQGLPGRLFGADRLERAALHSGEFNAAIRDAYPKAMFVLLPLFALFTCLAWRRHGRRYPAHLYLALHLHAAWFVALTVITIATGFIPSDAGQAAIALLGFAYFAWYTVVAFRAVFTESWPRPIGKSAIVALAYLPCWFIVSVALLGYALFRM